MLICNVSICFRALNPASRDFFMSNPAAMRIPPHPRTVCGRSVAQWWMACPASDACRSISAKSLLTRCAVWRRSTDGRFRYGGGWEKENRFAHSAFVGMRDLMDQLNIRMTARGARIPAQYTQAREYGVRGVHVHTGRKPLPCLTIPSPLAAFYAPLVLSCPTLPSRLFFPEHLRGCLSARYAPRAKSVIFLFCWADEAPPDEARGAIQKTHVFRAGGEGTHS